MVKARDVLLAGGGAAVGAGLGYVLATLEKAPDWAIKALNRLNVARIYEGYSWPLAFEFVGLGGWVDEQGRTLIDAEFVGWRNTGVGKGDADAYVSLHYFQERPDLGVMFDIYGTNLRVFVDEVEVSMEVDLTTGRWSGAV